MTTPPPPTCHPAPDGSGRQQWWDGQQWTENYNAPVATPQTASGAPSPTSPPSPKQPMGRGKKIAIGAGAVFAVFLIIGLIGSSLEDSDTAAAPASTSATPAEQTATTTATPPTSTTTPSSSRVAPAPPPRATTPKPAGCESAPPTYLATINAAFTEDYQLINTSAYQDGDTLYIAGEIATPEGKIRSRDDVFAVKNAVLTPVTSTARLETTLPDLRRVLDVNVTDPGAQKAMDCARTY
ncbi:DUF2510 domain-containing protein [Gordonia rubripertincta]|uniref:DUF2510 domain-containing protein n=1 Tax=Gordonia rubripertincta TaxID=36822 RepID=A0AAW4GBD7_GORRU|nr:DUF2510 domain-containing protein [Gordonia rubripertincta]MBM7280653.1 DUF2510 domain-containing protein [Gordonia rubripertincta]